MSNWSGMLCRDTVEAIAERFNALLGDEHFTLVCCNTYSTDDHKFSTPEVYPSQRISSPIRLSDSDYYGFYWATPRLSMGVSTQAVTQQDGRGGSHHDYVYFHFDGNRVSIEHYAPAGYRLLWIFAVERHEREDES